MINKELILELKKEYGDSFYLLDLMQFKKNYIELKESFSSIYPNFCLAYSYKTNYIPQLCKIVNECGGYAEVVSEMELELAKRCGVNTNRIIWNGPIKNHEIEKRHLLEGGTVNIDSLDEALFIEEIAKNTDGIINVGIRCNFDVNDGVISRFGLDTEGDEFKSVLDIINENKNIKLICYQCHFAKRDIEYWKHKTEGLLSLIESTGICPDRIDIGGGLYGKMEQSLKEQFKSYIPSYKEYADVIATKVADFFKNKEKKPELILEPGSALVGDCMKFVTTVKTIKNIRGKQIATVLGSQKNISMQGVNPPIQVINIGDNANSYTDLDIVGYTCIENDVIYKGYSGNISVGDVVVIGNCGSYSIVMKPPFILPNFPIIGYVNNKVEIIKKQEVFDDIFGTYSI